MKARLVLIALLGLALLLYLVRFVGFGAVISAALQVGLGGFVILCLYALAQFLILGAAWHVLLPPSRAGDYRVFVGARMVRDAVTDVLPFSQLGGIVLGARAAMFGGISQPAAVASTIVDVTTELLAQIAFVAVGVAILGARAVHGTLSAALTRDLAFLCVLAVIAAAALLALQRYSQKITATITGRLFPAAVSAGAAISTALSAIYRSPERIGVSSALHAGGWFASALGTWIAFHLIGVEVGIAPVMAIESLIGAARNAAVLVPNGLGVQEGGYLVLAPLFGVGPEFALAISLLKRARDIAIGVPVLIVWQAMEGRRALRAA
jgi:putative membrane protein